MITMTELQATWHEKDQWLTQYFEEIESNEFYRFLFPEGSLQEDGVTGDKKPKAVAIGLDDNHKARKVFVHDDLSEISEAIKKYPTIFMSPVGYFGWRNTLTNARYAYAMTFDIDYVSPMNLENIIHQAMKIDYIPKPTAIVNSGTGIHLYYVFEEPIPLYTGNQILLKELKRRLTEKIWNFATSLSKNKQFQGISQGFRLVGSQTKLGEEITVKAFWVGQGERVTLEYLNDFLVYENSDDRLNLSDFRMKGTIPLFEAKEKYPEWYEERIINKKKRGTWIANEALYQWWKNGIEKNIVVGHRYHSIIALVAYAEKCGIPYEQVEIDAYGMIDMLDWKTTEADNHFTAEDVEAALKAYEASHLDGKTKVHYTRRFISDLTGVVIPANKRNGRSTQEHLKRARAVQAIDYKDGSWRNKDGRPKKEQLVKDYLQKHPDNNPTQVARALGMSRTTVYKYMK